MPFQVHARNTRALLYVFFVVFFPLVACSRTNLSLCYPIPCSIPIQYSSIPFISLFLDFYMHFRSFLNLNICVFCLSILKMPFFFLLIRVCSSEFFCLLFAPFKPVIPSTWDDSYCLLSILLAPSFFNFSRCLFRRVLPEWIDQINRRKWSFVITTSRAIFCPFSPLSLSSVSLLTFLIFSLHFLFNRRKRNISSTSEEEVE